MTEEARRIMGVNKESFADRVCASVERYYTALRLQQELRKVLLGKRGLDKTSAANVPTAAGAYQSNRGLITAGVGGLVTPPLLGPGQYSKVDVPGSRGVATPGPAATPTPGSRGYSFSALPRPACLPIPPMPRHYARVTSEKKSDSKTATPLKASISHLLSDGKTHYV